MTELVNGSIEPPLAASSADDAGSCLDDREEPRPTFVSHRVVAIPRTVISTALESPSLGGILPTDVGYYSVAWGQKCSRPQGSEEAILIYCTAGKGWCQLGGQRLTIAPGELLIIPAGVSHEYGADDKSPWSIYWVHVHGPSTSVYLEALGTGQTSAVLYLGNDPRLIGLLVELNDVLDEGHDAENLAYGSNVVRHLLSMLIRRQRDARRVAPDASQRVAASLEFMKRNLARSLDIAQLSQMAKLSPSHYSALFKRQTGYSPVDYLMRLRMQLAAELLENTNQGIKAIAARLGYRDPLYFSRVFAGIQGVSPTEYRSRRRDSALVSVRRPSEDRPVAPNQAPAGDV